MIKAAMFDLDGTLVRQRKEYILTTVEKTLSELGLKMDEKFAYDFWYGSDRDDLIQKRLGIDYMKFWYAFWKYDNPLERANHTEVYEDVIILRNLMERSIKLGIVTGALTEVANAEIEKLGNYRFDSIVTNKPELEIRQKPYPDSLLIGLKELDVEDNEAMYVGNSLGDAEAAIRARIKPVIVLREGSEFGSYDNSITVVPSLHELLNIL